MVTWLAKNFTRWSCWPAMDTLILGKITKSSPVKPTFCLCKNTVTFTNRKSHIDLFTFFPIWYFDHSETRFDQTRISLRFDQTKISLCPTTVRKSFWASRVKVFTAECPKFVGRLRASPKTDLLFLSWSTGFKVPETHLPHLPVEACRPTASRSGRALLLGIMYWLLYKHIFREQELILTTTPSLKYTINSAGIQLFNTVNSLSLSLRLKSLRLPLCCTLEMCYRGFPLRVREGIVCLHS